MKSGKGGCFTLLVVCVLAYHFLDGNIIAVAIAVLSFVVLISILLLIQRKENRKFEKDLSKVDHMEGRAFEFWCASLLKARGWSNVQVTKQSGDGGADVIAYLGESKYAIQCKRYAKNVGDKAVGEVLKGKGNYGCNKAMVITNRFYTDAAIRSANNNNVILWDREDLKRELRKVEESGRDHEKEKKAFEKEVKRRGLPTVEKRPLTEEEIRYYKQLPEIRDRTPDMKEYIFMSLYAIDGEIAERNSFYQRAGDGVPVVLISEGFPSEMFAWHFARVFEKHSYAKVAVYKENGNFFVWGATRCEIVLANYREELDGFIFAN